MQPNSNSSLSQILYNVCYQRSCLSPPDSRPTVSVLTEDDAFLNSQGRQKTRGHRSYSMLWNYGSPSVSTHPSFLQTYPSPWALDLHTFHLPREMQSFCNFLSQTPSIFNHALVSPFPHPHLPTPITPLPLPAPLLCLELVCLWETFTVTVTDLSPHSTAHGHHWK